MVANEPVPNEAVAKKAGGRAGRGRQAEARRNDGRILDAALQVFAADPSAPMSAVARRADVGQASLYRRYPSRDHLLIAVCARGMSAMGAAARQAVAAPDPLQGLVDLLTWLVETGTLRMATLRGRFTPTVDLFELAASVNRDLQRVVERAIESGGLRREVTGADLTLIASQLDAIGVDDPARTAELRRRYLRLALDGLTRTDTDPLPGPAPTAAELETPWQS